MTEVLLQILKVTVMVLIFAIGMSSTLADVTYLLRRPGLLIRSIAAMYVVVPLVALALVKVLVLAPGVEVALLVLAVSAGGLMLPKRLMDVGQGSYVVSLVVLSSLLAIVTVPAWLAILGPLFGPNMELMPRDVARVIAVSFLLPLALGMLVRGLAPRVGERIADGLLTVAGAVLAVCFLLILVTHAGVLLEAGWPAILALAGITLVALVAGHLLGGPDPNDRTVLAISCATRHLGIVVLVAAAVPGPRTAALVGAYLVAVVAVTVPYMRWSRRHVKA